MAFGNSPEDRARSNYLPWEMRRMRSPSNRSPGIAVGGRFFICSLPMLVRSFYPSPSFPERLIKHRAAILLVVALCSPAL